MTIASVFHEGLAGYQAAQQSMQRSAHAIASAPVQGDAVRANAAGAAAPVQAVLEPADARDTAWANRRAEATSAPNASLEESLINLRIQSYNADASVNVMKTADRLLGTLIDTRV